MTAPFEIAGVDFNIIVLVPAEDKRRQLLIEQQSHFNRVKGLIAYEIQHSLVVPFVRASPEIKRNIKAAGISDVRQWLYKAGYWLIVHARPGRTHNITFVTDVEIHFVNCQ